MRASLRRASDWIYIRLADSQRSPASVMFEKQSGSPVPLRTYDPLVRSKIVPAVLVQLGFRTQYDFVAKISETLKQAVCRALRTKSVEVVGSQLSVAVSATNEMVGDDD